MENITETRICEWVYGPTGCGKSHYAFQNYSPDTHYDYDGSWDYYNGEEVVIIDNCDVGGVSYREVQRLIEPWPFEVTRRRRPNMIPFTSRRVIFISIQHPKDVLHALIKERRQPYEGEVERLLRMVNIREMEMTLVFYVTKSNEILVEINQ